MATVVNNGVGTVLMGGTSGAVMARAVRTGAQPVSTLRVPVKIARIADGGDLDITPVPVQFAQDLSDTLGNIGTPGDGWESLLGDMEMSIDGDAAGLSDVIAGLADITDIDFDSFQAATFDPIVADTGAVATAGDTLLAAFNGDLLPPAPPPPNPPPNPPPGGCCTLADISCCPPTCPPEGCTPAL